MARVALRERRAALESVDFMTANPSGRKSSIPAAVVAAYSPVPPRSNAAKDAALEKENESRAGVNQDAVSGCESSVGPRDILLFVRRLHLRGVCGRGNCIQR